MSLAGKVEESRPPGERLIEVRGLEKAFHRRKGGRVLAIAGVHLYVEAGEFFVLLGPSGCGKTTLLRCIGGLEDPDGGQIELAGRPVYSSSDGLDLPPEKRQTSMLFQSYALWPHMTVFDNVAYPLRSAKVGRSEVTERVHAALQTVHCDELADQYPDEISGGQQQRVALARALAPDHRVVLFDEPMSNVDAKVRSVLRHQLRQIQRRVGFAAVYVTHDQDEALELADRIAVLREGKIEQTGTPREVYQHPTSPYVARFLGSVNEINGIISAVDGDVVTLEVDAGWKVTGTWRSTGKTPVVGTRALGMFRPEWCEISLSGERSTSAHNVCSVVISDEVYLGALTEWVVERQGAEFRVVESAVTRQLAAGADAFLRVAADKVMIFDDEPGA